MAGEIRLRVVPGAERYSHRDPLILTPYLLVVYLYILQHKTQQLQRLAQSDSTSSNLTSNSRQRYITHVNAPFTHHGPVTRLASCRLAHSLSGAPSGARQQAQVSPSPSRQ
jgi:hypothetical protein